MNNSVQNSTPVIAVDGPSGTGKGSVCGRLAANLGWHLLDSGSLYRVLAYVAERQEIANDDLKGLIEAAHNLDLKFEKYGELVSILLEGDDISAQVRTEEMGNKASKIAIIPEVRAALLERQKAFQKSPGLVADGRDMGTVVFPQADLKIYLSASAEIRAQRRYKQLKEKGNDVIFAQLLTEINERDVRDSQRQIAPLKPAHDAIVIDTSNFNIEQVEQQVMEWVQKRELD